ncbi:MAG: hypothetical protein HC881_22235 [Leptolyngbyaceae cyanobacterium SL_7_1]|nr:hypothetical protein [Leptolyngbyaceae cyanobacterium SL_7_1]
MPLPTGIPAFVGFADAIAPLTALPQGVSLPAFVTYDSGTQRLICASVITEEQRQELLGLSSDRGFRQAVEALYQSTQPVVSLRRLQEFTNQLIGLPNGYLAAAVQGFFENGGTRCYVLRLQAPNESTAQAIALQSENLLAALKVLEPIADLDLVAIPDLMGIGPTCYKL